MMYKLQSDIDANYYVHHIDGNKLNATINNLELIDSTFLSTAKKFDMQNIIASAYIMVQPTSVLKKYKSNNIDDLINDALDWADANLEFDDISKLIEAIINQITKLNKVAPTVGNDTDVSDENGKKK